MIRLDSGVTLFGYGNPARGDDGLGPLLLERLQKEIATDSGYASFEAVCDFQLQIEHVTDMYQRRLLLFIDASMDDLPPFRFCRITPQKDDSYSSHSLTPAALLCVFQTVYRSEPPPAYLLAIPGHSFELGEGLSAAAESYLCQALPFVLALLKQPDRTAWEKRTN